jgi:transposase-like protein
MLRASKSGGEAMIKGKKWTSEEKVAAILEGLKGRPARDICRERGISDGQYYKWRDEALIGMKDGLKDKRSKEWRDNSWEVERNRLLKMIGEQQLIIDIQKKTFGDL